MATPQPMQKYGFKPEDLGEFVGKKNQPVDFNAEVLPEYQKFATDNGLKKISNDVDTVSDIAKNGFAVDGINYIKGDTKLGEISDRAKPISWKNLDAEGGDELNESEWETSHQGRYGNNLDFNELNLNDPADLKKAQSYIFKCHDVEMELIWVNGLLQKSVLFSQNIVQHYKYSIAVIEELLKRLKDLGTPSTNATIKVAKSVLKDAKALVGHADEIAKGLQDADQTTREEGNLIFNGRDIGEDTGTGSSISKPTPQNLQFGGSTKKSKSKKTQKKSHSGKLEDPKPTLYLPQSQLQLPPKNLKNLFNELNNFQKNHPIPDLNNLEKKTQKKVKKTPKRKTKKSSNK